MAYELANKGYLLNISVWVVGGGGSLFIRHSLLY